MAHEHAHAHTHEGLEVEVERTGPCQATIRLKVAKEEVQRTREQGLRNIAGRTRMKGFRPGKMPKQMMEKQFGEKVNHELVEHFLNHAYEKAVKEHDLTPAAHPRVNPAQVEIDPSKEFSFDFPLFLKPELKLGDYKGLKITSEPFEVGPDEVEETLADLRKRNARPERTEEDGLEQDGMAVCHLSFRVQDLEDPVLDREGIRMSPMTPPPGVDPEEFKAALLGLKESEERSIAIPAFPEDFPTEEARGKPGQLVVSASEVYRMVPPPEKEVFEAFEVEDEEGLKAALKTRIAESKAQQEEHRIEVALLERLLEETEMDLPDPLIEERAEMKVAELKKELEGEEDLDQDVLEARLDEERGQARTQQERALRAMYLIEEIAKLEELLVSGDEMKAELESIAERNGSTFEEVGKYYQEEGLLQQLGIELLERKVRRFLRESADIQGQ